MKPIYTIAKNKAEILQSAKMELLDENILVYVANIAHISSTEATILCEAERQRMAAYLIPADRARCFAAHVLKRVILAEVLNTTEPELYFSTDSFGRPSLLGNQSKLDFNISHSGNMVALAVSKGSSVGIDIEKDRREHDGLFYNIRVPGEEVIFKEPTDFLKMWTIKEAISKAIGTGISEKFETMKIEPNQLSHWDYKYKEISSSYYVVSGEYHLAISSQDSKKMVRIICTSDSSHAARNT